MQEPASVIDTVNVIRQKRQPNRKPPKLSKTRTNSAVSFALVNAPPEDPQNLTSQQRNFCLEYVRNKGNATKAARFAYNCTNDPSAGAVGAKLLVMEKIKAEIAKISEQTRASAVTPELITAGIVDIALNEKTRNGDRLKGFELLARLKGLLIDKGEQKNTIVHESVDLSKMSTAELIAALAARMRRSASGIQVTEQPAELGQEGTLSNKRDYVTRNMADESVSPALDDTIPEAQYSVESIPDANTSGDSDALIAINTGKHIETTPGGGGTPLGPGDGG